MDDDEPLGFAATVEVVVYTLVVTGGGFAAAGTLLSFSSPGPLVPVLLAVGTALAGLGGLAWRVVSVKLNE